VSLQLGRLTGISYDSWRGIARIVHLAILPFALIYFGYILFKRQMVPVNIRQFFVFVSGVMCIQLLGVLIYSSLTTLGRLPPPNDHVWTYINEGRYYLFLQIMIPVYVACMLWARKQFSGLQVFRIIFLFIVFVEILHSTYFIAKNFSPGKHEQGHLQVTKAFGEYLDSAIRYDKFHGDTPVFASNHGTICNYAVLYGATALYSYDELKHGILSSSKKIKLYFITTADHYDYYHALLDDYPFRKVGQFGYFTVFSCYITPRS
ncbi:MAG TPA: hypothetical protein VM012_08775, partial [Flavitalea sp.]|nr:hypothetical protein [Flavitalea sp.]